MKQSIGMVLAATLAISALGGCNFLMGPDEPRGKDGNLVISFGEKAGYPASRGITSAGELGEDVLAALRYQATLTGPGGEPPITREIRHGKSLELTVPVGVWKIEVRAYKDDGLAGTASLRVTVVPGLNVLSIPMALNGGYFDIVIGSLDHGTALSNCNAAFPGATITLTVTPDEGYVLKAGSLRVNEGAVPVAAVAESDSTYTFAMPAADATIGAFFARHVDAIVIQGPEDRIITVTPTHSAGHEPATEISFAEHESVTFTLDGAGYTAEDGNLQWLVNGDGKDGTLNYLTVEAREYALRSYTLTILIKEDGRWYSTETVFTVVP
jgi:hypothetical protein